MIFVVIIKSLSFVGRFMARNAGALLTRTFLPIVAGGLIAGVSLNRFFAGLQHYIAAPSERLASVVLGVIAAGLLLEVFVYSVAATATTCLAMGRDLQGWRYFPVSRTVWRVYAANLRFLMLLGGLVGSYLVFVAIAERLGFHLNFFANLCLMIGMAVVAIRCGFLILPIACSHTEGPVIRAAWRLSHRAGWQIAVLLMIAIVVALAAETACERVVLHYMEMHIARSDGTFVGLIGAFRATLPFMIPVLVLSGALFMYLHAPASVEVHRHLASQA